MAEFRINVVVDPTGAQRGTRVVNRELQRTERTADRLRGFLVRAFAFAGIAIGIDQLRDLADTFTLAQNRVRTVTDSIAELNVVTEELFDIAQRTRTGFRSTTEVFARAALAVRELGISQAETLQFTESLNQAVILSGASSLETNAALIQLSQGLASGTLRGDELRSVLEQVPVVADVIAQSLGVTRGELRELGSEGRLTADLILRAFREARVELADRFGETVPTIGQAFTVLRNSIAEFIGFLDQSIGVSSGLAEAILVLAENLDTLGIAVGAVAAVFAGRYLASLAASASALLASRAASIEKARADAVLQASTISATRTEIEFIRVTQASLAAQLAEAQTATARAAIRGRLAANTAALIAARNAETAAVTRLAAANAAASTSGRLLAGSTALVGRAFALLGGPVGVIFLTVTALTAFSDEIQITEGGLVTLRDVGVATFTVIRNQLEPLGNAFSATFSTLSDAITDTFGEVNISIEGVLRFAARSVDQLIGIWILGFNSIVAVFMGLPAAIAEIFIDVVNVAISSVENLVNAFADGLSQLTEFAGLGEIPRAELTRLQNNYEGAGVSLGEALAQGAENAFSFRGASNLLNNILEEAESIALDRELDRAIAAEEELEARTDLAIAPTPTARPADTEDEDAFARILRELDNEAEALRLTSAERERFTLLLRVENELKRALTETERELILSRADTLQSLSDQAQILDEIRGPQEEYARTLEAANALLEAGTITLQQYNQVLRETDLASSIQQLQDVLAEAEDVSIRLLEEQLLDRQELINQALQARIISEQEANRLIVESNRQTANEIRDIETERFRSQLADGQTTFQALTQITRSFAGEQSSIYRGLFAVSKAFAIADAGVQIANALAKAANTPFPANLAAIATVASQTANIISTIQGTQFAGSFQTGGEFMVGGQGGPDSQLVSMFATPGERVSVQTPSQQREADAPAPAQPQGDIRIVNVVDPSMVEDFLNSPAGERVLINRIERNRGSINSILNGSV